jgi:DNA-binding CsgD family transcriptional regulator/tetratricopeptide (TPR) repeat protein
MLLERESAVASLGEYAADARHGNGRLVLISGEAGVGKSSLVEQLERDQPAARWLWGACDGLFTPRPLGPLFDVAAQLGGELLDLCRAHAHRDDLFGALLRQITDGAAATATPTVVVIEDMHWADEATVDLLRFLGRRLRNTDVLVLATYRDDLLSFRDPLRIALGELATQRSTRRIGLAPLSPAAVATLADGSGLDVVELYRLTNGNPFYVTEVVRGGMQSVPPSARDAVLARVARLSDAARDLLEIAAPMGTRIELQYLASMVRCDREIVDELLSSGLLSDDSGSLAFRHEIARLAVEQSIAAHRRMDIHGRILDALSGLGCDDDARMAFHAEAAGNGPATVAHAQRAAHRSAELGSHWEAAAQFERALRFAACLDDEALAGLYESYAHEVSILDRWEDAAVAGQRALDLWRTTGNRLREGDMLRRLSRTMWRLCRSDDATTAAEAAVATLEPLGPSAELAWAYANLANQRLLDRDADATIDLARRALAIAEPLGVAAVHSDATNTMACARANAGGDWEDDLHRALDVAQAHGLQAQTGRAFTNLYGTYCAERRFGDGERYLRDGLAYCDERDMDTYVTCLHGEQTSTMEKTGRWAEAVALSTGLLARVASPINRINPLTSLGTIRARRGDDGVWALLDEAERAADGSREAQWIVAVRLARAEAFWLEDKTDAAIQEVERAEDLSARCNAWERGAIAVWLRRTGSVRTLSGNLAEPYQLMSDGDRARAACVWSDLGCPFEAALALYDGTDEVELRDALDRFESLGATPAVQLTRQRMRRFRIRSVPVGARSATRADPLGLTRREREVLDLICEGHTNAEIAGRLFISAKTVDHHVSAVLGKLDAPNRVDAASKAARLGLVATEK